MFQVKARDLINLIPDHFLENIGKDLGVDKHNQKLTGLKMFKVMLYSLSTHMRISLRTIEIVYSKLFSDKESTRHSSLAVRLSKINIKFFEEIFNHLVSTYHDKFAPKFKNNIYRFDPTVIGLSSKLFAGGLCCGGPARAKIKKNFIKIVIGQKNIIPSSIMFCNEKKEVSDNYALKNAILAATLEKEDIVIFDRGLNSSNGLSELDDNRINFITRATVGRRYKLVEKHKVGDQILSASLEILSDETVQLFDKNEHCVKTYFRLVKARSLKDQKEIWFLTNIFSLDAIDITELYARRWDIEVFFRFIKQELNLKHFLARNLNGMAVFIYMILIFSILLLIYKTKNYMDGYKLVKAYFLLELEIEITADVIEAYGGDKNRYLCDKGFA